MNYFLLISNVFFKPTNIYQINFINGRIPLIEINYRSQKMDILLAPIPFKNIPESLNLTSYENDEIINDNINTLNKSIDKMMETDDIQYIKSILILTGYRYTYRAKFHLIHYSTRENFTLLLRAVKLWAKKKHIYSNIFGYLSGSILIVMVTKICLIYPFGEINFLLQQFFQIYGAW
uniref:polynucleotide adenylyltransferase n=3 Tax=Meloidogyne TaxID=189290 RepID=A0A914MMZ0_MELIC